MPTAIWARYFGCGFDTSLGSTTGCALVLGAHGCKRLCKQTWQPKSRHGPRVASHDGMAVGGKRPTRARTQRTTKCEGEANPHVGAFVLRSRVQRCRVSAAIQGRLVRPRVVHPCASDPPPEDSHESCGLTYPKVTRKLSIICSPHVPTKAPPAKPASSGFGEPKYAAQIGVQASGRPRSVERVAQKLNGAGLPELGLWIASRWHRCRSKSKPWVEPAKRRHELQGPTL